MALPDLTPKPLTKAARRAFDAICDEWFETARARSGQLGLSVPEPLATELRDQALAQIEEPAPWTSCPSPLLQRLVLPHLTAIGSPVLEGFAVVEGVSVVHVLRLVRLLGSDQERLFRTAVAAANAEAMGWGDLRVVAEAYRFCALPTTELLAEYLAEPVHPWATTIWPSFADHLDHLASALSGPRPAAWRCWAEGAPDRDRVLAVVAAFPTLPAELVEPLWRMGLGRDRDGGRRGASSSGWRICRTASSPRWATASTRSARGRRAGLASGDKWALSSRCGVLWRRKRATFRALP